MSSQCNRLILQPLAYVDVNIVQFVGMSVIINQCGVEFSLCDIMLLKDRFSVFHSFLFGIGIVASGISHTLGQMVVVKNFLHLPRLYDAFRHLRLTTHQ